MKKKLDITVVVSIASLEIQKKLLSGGEKEFKKWTLKSLKEEWKKFDFELIRSPADLTLPQSYNSIADKIKTKYIAFLHHDLWLMEDGHWLEKAVKYLDSLPDVGIAGVCGKTIEENPKGIPYPSHCLTDGFPRGHILYQKPYHRRHEKSFFKPCGKKGKYYVGAIAFGYPICKPAKVQTLDSMVMIIPTKVFKKLKFDEQFSSRYCICEDYCISIQYYLGLTVYSLPLATWHKPHWHRRTTPAEDKRIINESLKMVKQLGQKWKGKVPYILSTSYWSGKNIFNWNIFMKWVNKGMPYPVPKWAQAPKYTIKRRSNITVVVCIASREIFNKILGPSLKKQNVSYEFIEAPLKVTDEKPASAQLPECYNSVIDRITTKYALFIHQDVLMMENTWLQRAEKFCDGIEDLGVAGVAGKSWGGKCTGWILMRGHPSYSLKNYYGKKYHALIFGYGPFEEPQLSMTLDQMAFIVPLKVLKKVKFYEGYDIKSPMYMSEDYCLAVKHHLGLNTYALPLKTWHNPFGSSGISKKTGKWDYKGRKITHDKTALKRGKILLKKRWKGKFNLIFATCDIDKCPKCKINPCRCTKPLSMEETIKYAK